MASADSWAWARQAREAAVQMLYQWEIGRLSVPEVADSFWRIGDTDVELPEPRARARLGSCRRHRRGACPRLIR
jgi:transcription termination factor NusB